MNDYYFDLVKTELKRISDMIVDVVLGVNVVDFNTILCIISNLQSYVNDLLRKNLLSEDVKNYLDSYFTFINSFPYFRYDRLTRAPSLKPAFD